MEGMHDCDVCGATVQELRRGRCWGCYNRWVDSRPVGYGARCLGCSERRRRLLRSVELWGGWQPLCFNCAGQALSLTPAPRSAAELKEALDRDRRERDRRIGKADSRVFRYERRVGDRRSLRDDCASIEDDMIIEITVDMAELARAETEVEFDDMTRIRELPAF
jgi:hypothetical protein